jgi:molecular chaperone DnaK (HSP70)
VLCDDVKIGRQKYRRFGSWTGRSSRCGSSSIRRYSSDRTSANNDGEKSQRAKTIGVGIDLGTTNSAVAFMEQDRPVIITVDNARTIPSVVAFIDNDDDGREKERDKNVDVDESNSKKARHHRVLVGHAAAEQDFAYRNVKRIIGTGGNAPSSNAHKVVPGMVKNREGKTYKKNNLSNRLYDAIHFPTQLTYRVNQLHRPNNNKDNGPEMTTAELFNNNGSDNEDDDEDHSKSLQQPALVSPERVSSYIVRKLIDAAELYTGQIVDRAVIGIPAYFDDAQTNATIMAGELAGIHTYNMHVIVLFCFLLIRPIQKVNILIFAAVFLLCRGLF